MGHQQRIDFNNLHIHLYNNGRYDYLNLNNMAKAYGAKAGTVKQWLTSDEATKVRRKWEATHNKPELEFDSNIQSLLKDSNIIRDGNQAIFVRDNKAYDEGIYAVLEIAYKFAKSLNPHFEKDMKRLVKEANEHKEMMEDLEDTDFDRVVSELMKGKPKK